MSATRIGIAVVESDGWFLVGTRQAGQVLAGHAEFPGGKCRSNESPADCAVRECLEETGLVVTAVELIDQTRFEYVHGTVDLHFWLCRPDRARSDQSFRPPAQNGFGWVAAAELDTLPFPEANRQVVLDLRERF